MSIQRNNSGKQLSSSDWLKNHHDAKKELRYSFTKKLVELNPNSIIDIGCGTGLWLSILHEVFPKSCKFIGVDIDKKSLEEAKKRAANWDRNCEWLVLDINKEPEKIPSADLALIFNFSSYVDDLEILFSNISPEKGFKSIALRQFAGDEIKFGPFIPEVHTAIDLSIKDSIGNSNQIRYFDMDRLINIVSSSKRKIIFQDFELFRAFSPFKDKYFPYILGTADWTAERVSKYEKKVITDWITKANSHEEGLYFFSLDWIAILL